MRYCRLLPVALLLVSGVVAAPPSTDAKPDAEHIAQLIQQLGSRKFSTREAASKALDQIGEPALEALKAAAQSADPEVRSRSQKLAKAISQRTASARLLAPKRLRLNFHDTPVEQAVAELSRKSGYAIRLVGDKKTWANRKVTLDTGDTTFWRAFDAFCDKARLVEAPAEVRHRPLPQHLPMIPAVPARPRPAIRGGAAVPAVRPAVVMLQLAPPRGGGVPLPVMKIRPGFMAAPSNEFRLMAGEPAHRPTSYFGAIRIQAEPGQHGSVAPAAGKRPVVLGLEVTPEPRLRVWNVVNVRVDKAIDDQSQHLAASTNTPGSPPPLARRAYPVMNTRLVSVQLQAGEKPSRMLKHFKGIIHGTVRDEDKVLLTMDNILQAANKTFKDPTVGTFKVDQAAKNEDGTYTIQVDMQYGYRVLPATTPRPAPVIQRPPGNGAKPAAPPARGLGLQRPGPMTLYLGLSALDEHGVAMPISRVSTSAVAGGVGWRQRVTLTFKPTEGQAKPAKLTFTGSRMVEVTVPFELTDAPLS